MKPQTIHHYQQRQKAFSLMEIAVVLVVISLLAAAIVIGRDMVDNAETAALAADIEKYRTATNQFAERYEYMPGDYPKATTSFSGAGVANGDSDGRIGDESMYPPGTRTEPVQFWKHLSEAGLIEGSFSGALDASGRVNPGENIPVTKIEGVSFTALFMRPQPAGTIDYFPSEFGNMFVIGKREGFAGYVTDWAGLTPEQAFMIDSKVDDGKPAFGNVTVRRSAWAGGNCVSNTTASLAEYRVSDPDIICVMMVYLDRNN
jgi:prepilin-type N-terminal cleavage/methylation domain-containing protein